MKNKYLVVSVFLITLLIGFISIESKEVKAESTDDNCKTYINYYPLLAADTKSNYEAVLSEKSDGIHSYTATAKGYLLQTGATIINDGQVTIGDTNDKTTITLQKYYNMAKASEKDPYSPDGGKTTYTRANSWYDEGGSNRTDGTGISNTFEEFQASVPDGLGHAVITMTNNNNNIELEVKRTWHKGEIDKLNINDDAIVYSPAMYYVEYKVCGYDTKANFVEKTTNKTLDTKVIETGLQTGYTYDTYTCPEKYVKDNKTYILSTTDKKTFSGKINNEDVDFNCYYNEKKSTITLNFGTNKDCTTGTDIRKSETKEYEVGQNIKYTVPEIKGYDFSEVGNISKTFDYELDKKDLSFTVPDKNTSICLVYVNNSQTGLSWIYFVWIIGIAALAYSMWYFIRYNKRNSEI